ncbi:hypothetical protein [Parapedobacter sp. 2B3]|uniref:hypothetical protein n=1 Tax=Parapedobacter sp. 2B3 TaxID=3342381 RepID=UPI0035B65EBE
MEDLIKEEKQSAIRISRALQAFFNENPGTTVLRSDDAYDILVTKGLVERDRHHGIKFRDFLRRLKEAGALSFIPQCQPEPGNGHYTNWYFRSVSAVTPLVKSPIRQKISTDGYAALRAEIDTFDKVPESRLNYVAKEIRKTYPRAYEHWTLAEVNLLQETAKQIACTLELSKIFGRQPSAIKRKLKELDCIGTLNIL